MTEITPRLIHIDSFILKLCINIMGLNPNPIIMKIMPPISSLFHDKSNKRIKTKDGIRCIDKLSICCHIVSSEFNASIENILINRIPIMQIIRGNQCNTRVDIFITFIIHAVNYYTLNNCTMINISKL